MSGDTLKQANRKLKILYVSGMGTPLRDVLSGKGEDDVTHAPGFFQPWYRLAKRGHQVDFVVTSNWNEQPNIQVDWFCEKNLKANIYNPALEAPSYKRIFRRISRLARLAYHTNKAIREENYDFIVCWAFYEGLVGNVLANIYNIPCGMRAMGTMLYSDLERYGAIRLAWRKPVEYVSYKLAKAYFMMTDDGTKGDIVYWAWQPRRHKYKYLFWKTGVEIKAIEEVSSKVPKPDHPYLFFAARFDRWKRHDKVLLVLKRLHDAGYPVHLYLCGSVQSRICLQEIKMLISELELEEHVHFLGSVSQNDVRFYAYHAVANPFFYDHSNLGNVFFETFSTGSVVVGLNDGSLNEYVEHGKNGFLVKDVEQAANIIGEILAGKIDSAALRAAALQTARETVIDRNLRFDTEVDLIEAIATARKPNYGRYRNGIYSFPLSRSHD